MIYALYPPYKNCFPKSKPQWYTPMFSSKTSILNKVADMENSWGLLICKLLLWENKWNKYETINENNKNFYKFEYI
jgi:hypothetical protein